jgi:putative ABC transport system permease protein
MYALPTSVPYAGLQKGRTWRIQNSDVEVIKQKVNTLLAISPGISGGSPIVSHGTHHQSYSVEGITPSLREAQMITIVQGRDLSELDMRECRKVCVIGSQVKKVIFPDVENPVGQYVLCGSMYLRVIGVLKEENSGWQSQVNEQVQVPFTTLQKLQHKGDEIEYMAVVSKPNVPVEETLKEISTILKQQHNISPEDTKAVGYNDFSLIFTVLSTLTSGIFALVWLIGLGSLLSGAVGVSNIMLVTVRERTKEIGIRRAIGASPWMIARQVVAESVVLTSVAGVLGIMIGAGILTVAEKVLAFMDTDITSLQISFSLAILCLLIIVIVGALAGLMPALRALKVKPIEALNEE